MAPNYRHSLVMSDVMLRSLTHYILPSLTSSTLVLTLGYDGLTSLPIADLDIDSDLLLCPYTDLLDFNDIPLLHLRAML